jgi:hypothetical protein
MPILVAAGPSAARPVEKTSLREGARVIPQDVEAIRVRHELLLDGQLQDEVTRITHATHHRGHSGGHAVRAGNSGHAAHTGLGIHAFGAGHAGDARAWHSTSVSRQDKSKGKGEKRLIHKP